MINDINRILKIISHYKKFIIIILITFIAIGSTYSLHIKTPMYKSTATFVLVQNSNNGESITQTDITLNRNLVSTYMNIAKSNKVLKQVIENLNLEISEKELAKQISVESVKNTEVLKISVSDKDNSLAADIANELAMVFSKEVSNLYSISNVHIMDLAEKTNKPYNINHIKDIAIFIIIGIVVSSLFIFIIYVLDGTIKSVKDVENYTDLTVLSTIPLTNPQKNSELIVKEQSKSVASEAFKTLRTNIMYSIRNKKLKTILITSGQMGEGKSFVSSNLAITFAQSGKKVIFIDTDMRKGRLQRIFNIKDRKGLSNLLFNLNNNKNEKININEYINETHIQNLHLITAGDVPPNPSELLGSENMKKLLYTLNMQYDIVICDSAPCMLVTDSVVLSKIVDTTLIVTSNKTTKIANLLETEKAIKMIGGNVSGVVINKYDESSKEYKNGYYYGNIEDLNEKENIKIEENNDLLKNPLYLQDIKIEENEEEIEIKEETEENNKDIIKTSKQLKENSKEIKELKSLYKVLMKNTLNILLNKEEKAESILNNINDIKNTYRDDIEQLRNKQNSYELELSKLRNKQEESKKEINKIKINQKENKTEIGNLKETYINEISQIKEIQNNYGQDINAIREKQEESKKEINKIKINQKENKTEIGNLKETYINEIGQIKEIQNNYGQDIDAIREKQEENKNAIYDKEEVNKELSEELKRYKQQARNINKIKNKQDEYEKQLQVLIEEQKYKEEIETLKEQFIKMQEENQNQINSLLNKIEELKETKNNKEENNINNIKETEEKIIDIQEYIKSSEAKYSPVKITNTTYSPLPVSVREKQTQKNENKKIFAFFNKKGNKNIVSEEDNWEDNNGNEIVSQILFGTK